MAPSLSWNHLIGTIATPSAVHLQLQHQRRFSFSVRAQEREEGRNVNRVWRRRKLQRKDERLRWDEGRVPFREEVIHRVRDSDKHICFDIDMMLLSEENRFDFVNKIIAEAHTLEDKDPDAYGAKKPVLHALTNRINAMGDPCPEAYLRPNPFNCNRHNIRDQAFFL